MLQPARTKFRKAHKGRINGHAERGATINFGSHGLQALEPERVTSRQIEAARIALTRHMKRAMQATMRIGAKGIKVMISGRLAGNEIARTEWLREGSVPLHTLRAEVYYAECEAMTTYGIIGIKVYIYKGVLFQKDLQKKIDSEKEEEKK